MVYTRPSVHQEATANGRQDFICTNAVNYRIIDDVLYGTVQMRSNDAVYGYRNDYAWQKHVLDLLSRDLHCEGNYLIWQAASLHVYPRHFNLVRHYARTGEWNVPLSV